MITREQTAVLFKIHSATLTAEDVQARTGLAPDESWKLGDARGAFGAVEKMHGFVLNSKVRVQESLDEHLKAMIKRLAPHAQKIGALANEAKIELCCMVHRKIAPALKFERDDLRWLGVMGARLDIDISILSEPQRPSPFGQSGQSGQPAPGGQPSPGGDAGSPGGSPKYDG